MRRFSNLDPAHRPRNMREIVRWGILDRLTGRRCVAAPGPPAPRVDVDLERLHDTGGPPRLTWIGHASFLVHLDGRRILVDPNFARRLGLLYPRYGKPAFEPEDLPPIDLLLITHNHPDHLDAPSVLGLPRTTPVVTPLGVGRWFRRRGFRDVTELDRWQTASEAGLEVTLTPSRHWSRRGVLDQNKTLWGGFVVRGDQGSVYHAGDTAAFDGFAEIGRRFPGLDAAILPIGGYEPAWFMGPAHMSPEEAGEAFVALGARLLVPMHWGTFQLSDEPISEPPGRLRAWWEAADLDGGRELAVLKIGETLTLRQI